MQITWCTQCTHSPRTAGVMTTANCMLILLFCPVNPQTLVCILIQLKTIHSKKQKLISYICMWIKSFKRTNEDTLIHHLFHIILTAFWGGSLSCLLYRHKFFHMSQNILTIARIDHICWDTSQTIPPLQCISVETASPLSRPRHHLLFTVHVGNKYFIALLLQLAWIVH